MRYPEETTSGGMAKGIHISIKYKFLGVLLSILLFSLGIFFYFTYTTFAEDKKLFVIDLNLTLLKAATSDIKLELKSRLEELQILIPRIYHQPAPIPVATASKAQPGFIAPPSTPVAASKPSPASNPFQGLAPSLAEEVLGVTFYKRNTAKQFEPMGRWANKDLLTKRGIPEATLDLLNERVHLPLASFSGSEEPRLMNRSVNFTATPSPKSMLGVLTILINGTFVEEGSKEMIIAVDLDSSFLRKALEQSEMAQIFLIYKDGGLLAHPSIETTIEYAVKPFPHPIAEKIKGKIFARESTELMVDGEDYLCSVSETGYPSIYAVAQIRKSEAFLALTNLIHKFALISLLIVCVAIFFSTYVARRLTSNIRLLRSAAQSIGQGKLDVRVKIRSHDEVQQVAESFEWMAARLEELMEETAKKARLQEELETARLVQSTLLTTPEIPSDEIAVASHYAPATECGGDFWDAYLSGNTLTLFIGDATGHGAPAAIVTAVAKSCFSTLNTIYAGQVLRPEEFLATLNLIINHSCRGKLLMTMCIIQLDITTGNLLVCNAGHEAPLCQRAGANSDKTSTDKKRKATAEVLFARGERLGHDPKAQYESVSYQMKQGDTLLLYTDGISEARNTEGKEWGERALKKVFGQWGEQSLNRIKTQMVEAVSKHTGDAAQEDDITFVLLRWNPTQAVKPSVGPPKLVAPSSGGAPQYSLGTSPATKVELEISADSVEPPTAVTDIFKFLEVEDDSREALNQDDEIEIAEKKAG